LGVQADLHVLALGSDVLLLSLQILLAGFNVHEALSVIIVIFLQLLEFAALFEKCFTGCTALIL
jgi:hypothetical protein